MQSTLQFVRQPKLSNSSNISWSAKIKEIETQLVNVNKFDCAQSQSYTLSSRLGLACHQPELTASSRN